MSRPPIRNCERTERTMELILPTFIGFRLNEVRQYLGVAPTRGTPRRPFVIVGAMAANVDHRIHGTRSAEHAPSRQVHAPIVEMRLRLGREVPIVFGLK